MVYTNLVSSVNIKSLVNNTLTTNVNYVTSLINFSESGMDKEVSNTEIFGETVITNIKRPTTMDLTMVFLLDSTDSIPVLLRNMGDLDLDSGVYTYTFEDINRRHRIALTWQDVTTGTTFMKIYYNMYVEKINISKSDVVEVSIQGKIPIKDITTGKYNYVEYEGTSASTILTARDTLMGW